LRCWTTFLNELVLFDAADAVFSGRSASLLFLLMALGGVGSTALCLGDRGFMADTEDFTSRRGIGRAELLNGREEMMLGFRKRKSG
jgi:hypothetical protein